MTHTSPPGGPPPQPGTRAPDGSVWNGQFWEASPDGGPRGAHVADEIRTATAPGRRERRMGLRRTIAITVGALAATVAAAVALPLLGEVPDFVGTTFDEVVTTGGIAVVALLGYWLALLLMPYRRWSQGGRGVGEPQSPWLDLLRGALALVPAAAVAAIGNATDDAVLALAGALAAGFFGYVAAIRIPRVLLDYTGKIERHLSRRTRWSRALVAALLGVASLVPILLVPGYGTEQLVLGAIILAVAVVVTWVAVFLAHVLPVGF